MKNTPRIFTWSLAVIALVITSAFSYSVLNEEEGDKLLGVWEPSHGKAKVKITKVGNKYFGKIVWLKFPTYDDGAKKADRNNPDPKMHDTPLLGYKILKDFEYVGKKTWENGTIYDPENGSTYNCVIKLKDNNTIEVRGYIGVSAIGRTDTWKRLSKD
jgi:uncharacterized protein (DUF2147 family)